MKKNKNLSEQKRDFISRNLNMYSTNFSSAGKKSNRLTDNPPSNDKDIFYGKQMSNSDRGHRFSQNFLDYRDNEPEEFIFDNHYSAAENSKPFISASLGEYSSDSRIFRTRNQNDQSVEYRKLKGPATRAGWTPLDEEYKAVEDGDYYDEISPSEDNYQFTSSRKMSEPDSYIDQLQFFLTSPVDIPKLGVQDNFKPIEVLYNEMFQDGSLHSSKQSRSLEDKYLESVSWVTSRPRITERSPTSLSWVTSRPRTTRRYSTSPSWVTPTPRSSLSWMNSIARTTASPFSSAQILVTRAPFIPTRPTPAPNNRFQPRKGGYAVHRKNSIDGGGGKLY